MWYAFCESILVAHTFFNTGKRAKAFWFIHPIHSIPLLLFMFSFLCVFHFTSEFGVLYIFFVGNHSTFLLILKNIRNDYYYVCRSVCGMPSTTSCTCQFVRTSPNPKKEKKKRKILVQSFIGPDCFFCYLLLQRPATLHFLYCTLQ